MAILSLPSRRNAVHSTPIHGVGLDFNGVFRDDMVPFFGAFCDIMRELGGTPPETYADYVRRIRSNYHAFFVEHGIEDGEQAFMERFTPHAERGGSLAPFDDMADFLAHTNALDMTVFIVTGAPRYRTYPWLERHELHRTISHIVYDSRDKAHSIIEACERLGLEPSHTCFVGDLGLDMTESKQAGCHPIGITRGYDTADALYERGAAHVVTHLSDLALLFS